MPSIPWASSVPVRQRRVLYAGLIHETHTFLDSPTALADFCVTLGDAIHSKEGDGSVVDGFLAAAREFTWEVVPTVVMTAMPSGMVADDVVEYFWSEFSTRVRIAMATGVDAIFLSLHGAMVAQSFNDVEGELLKRIRTLSGAESLPVFGTLDLHANASARMTLRANGLVAFRENPHIDARATSIRAAGLLQRTFETGRIPRMLWRGVPIVWAPTGTGTARDPMRSLEEMARAIEASDPGVWAVNVLAGYSFADTRDTGVSLSLMVDETCRAGEKHLDALAACAWALRASGDIRYATAREVLEEIGPTPAGPVVLVEPSDNIGGGAPGDGTGLLRALLDCDAAAAVMVINDPVSVRRTQDVPLGSTLRLAIGGRSWAGDQGSVTLEATLVSRSDGVFELEDHQSHLAAAFGRRFEMGNCAVVRHRGITLLLTSRKTPPFDLGQLRSQAIEPKRMNLIGVKAAVAHSRAYDPIARASYFVETPGPCSSRLEAFPFRHLRRPVFPLDPSCPLPDA